MRRMTWGACTAALAIAQAIHLPVAWASEEVFRPVVPAASVAPAKLKAASGLKWRARGASSAVEPQQPAVRATDAFAPAGEARQVSAVEPDETKRPAAVALRANQISTKQTRARLRDSVMQVGAYEDPQAPPTSDSQSTAAKSQDSALRDPFESATEPATPSTEAAPALPVPETTPVQSAPPAMPDDVAPPAVDDLFRDEPLRQPREPAVIPPEEREQLLDRGLSTEPGGVGCADQHDECQRALQELQKRDITTITVGLLIEGVEGTDFPCDCRLGRDFDAPKFAGRNFAPTLFTWKASGTCSKPLYFQDVQLERYGHSWNPVVQPFMSAAHFFVSVPLLPYKMGLRPPNECVYSLGYYRPGSCAPYLFEPIPLSLRAALFEGAGATAFAFWFWPPH